MAEDQSKEHEEHQRAHRVEQSASEPERASTPEDANTNQVPLFSASSLSGRGNAPVRANVMQRMQQTHGNRATGRFLQRAATAPAPATDEDLSQRIAGKAGSGNKLDANAQNQLEQ